MPQQTKATVTDANRPKLVSRRVIVLVSVSVLVVIVLVVLRSSQPPQLPPVVVMSAAAASAEMKPPLPDRWIPATWGWLWRFKDRVLGQRKTVLINTMIFKKAATFDVTEIQSEPESIITNGFRVWILKDAGRVFERLQSLAKTGGVELVSSPRFSTGDGIRASMFIGQAVSTPGGQGNVGINMDIFPRIYATATDLTMALTCTEVISNQIPPVLDLVGTNLVAVRTNFAVAARLQIPQGGGAYVLGGTDKPAGVFIFPIPQGKK